MIRKDDIPKDYIGDDGLLCCGICHQKKQVRFTSLGVTRVVECLCNCNQNNINREYQAQEARLAAMFDINSDGNTLSKLTLCRFDNLSNTRKVKPCMNYVNRFEDMLKNNTGLLLWGAEKEDLTLLSACMANALIENGYKVAMTNFGKMLHSGFKADELNEELNKYQLLIFDYVNLNLRNEPQYDYIFKVLTNRQQLSQPVIIITQMQLSEFNEQTDNKAIQICKLIKQMCFAIEVNNSNNKNNCL